MLYATLRLSTAFGAPSDQEPVDGVVRKRRIRPLCTLFSLLSAPLHGLVSFPVWVWIMPHDPSTKSDIVYAAAAIGLAVITAGAGAVLGVVIAAMGNVRREPWVYLRQFGIIANLFIIAFAFFALSCLRH
jgi:hypothetical protein